MDHNSELLLTIKNKSVLLVEDDQDTSAFLSRLIEFFGGTVDFAQNGLEGVLKVIENSYDVILMDLQMPVLDGQSAVKVLRATGYEGPVIAVTSSPPDEIGQDFYELGFDDYLTKPVNRMHLMFTIAGAHRARSQ